MLVHGRLLVQMNEFGFNLRALGGERGHIDMLDRDAHLSIDVQSIRVCSIQYIYSVVPSVGR